MSCVELTLSDCLCFPALLISECPEDADELSDEFLSDFSIACSQTLCWLLKCFLALKVRSTVMYMHISVLVLYLHWLKL